jgi:hypothetical protein
MSCHRERARCTQKVWGATREARQLAAPPPVDGDGRPHGAGHMAARNSSCRGRSTHRRRRGQGKGGIGATAFWSNSQVVQTEVNQWQGIGMRGTRNSPFFAWGGSTVLSVSGWPLSYSRGLPWPFWQR